MDLGKGVETALSDGLRPSEKDMAVRFNPPLPHFQSTKPACGYGVSQPSITWHIIFPASSCRNENCDWLPNRTANGPRPNPPTAITCNGIPLEKPKSARRRVTSGSSAPKVGLGTMESMCATAPLLSFDKGIADIGCFTFVSIEKKTACEDELDTGRGKGMSQRPSPQKK